MHSLLKRQLRKFFGSDTALPEGMAEFVVALDESYASFDSDREMLHRAMELSSAELTQANSELRAIFQAIPDTILRLDRNGRVIPLKAIERDDASLCGASDQRPVITHVSDFADLDVAAKFSHALEQLLEDGRAKVFEYSAATEAGERFYEVRLVPLMEDSAIAIIQETTARKRAEVEHEKLNQEWIQASRNAGMAEVATGVLHNVGNVLNSVNVSAGIVASKLRRSKAEKVAKAAALLTEKNGNLAQYLTDDANGKKLPEYLAKLGDYLVAENAALLTEVDQLGRNIEHIKEVVSMQQSYAKLGGVFEELPLDQLVEDAIAMNYGAFERHRLILERQFSPAPPARVERHKVLQILINLLRNAKYALDEVDRPDKKITVTIQPAGEFVMVSITDNGIGIPAENLNRIFGHGFTTRDCGHGFGLHSGANAAKEMGGTLTASSDGLGCGATFALQLPLAPEFTKNE